MREHQLQAQVGPLFLLRNPLAIASRMRRGIIRGFCHGVGSTSTQQLGGGGADADAASSFLTVPSSVVGSCGAAESEAAGGAQAAVTLEQMILQLDLEEEAAARTARRAAGEERYHPRRMSCVNSSDRALRSARDALSQYPRFSLDGRDAMYRASFSSYYEGMGLAAVPRDVPPDRAHAAAGRHGGERPRASVGCAAGAGYSRARTSGADGYEMDLERMPAVVAGESVVWCEPGVVAKLMGLEAVPVPVRGGRPGGGRRKASGPPLAATGGGGGRKQRVKRMGKEELEKERLFMALHGYNVGVAGACHAGTLQAAVGPDVSGLGRNSLEFRFPS